MMCILRAWLGLTLSILTILTSAISSSEILELAAWRNLRFRVPSNYPGCSSPNYDPLNSVINSEKAFIRGIQPTLTRLFLTIPRFYGPSGYPCTLGYIIRPEPGCPELDTPIEAYPSWKWHQDAESGRADCSALVSASHARIDKCNRLWVLDSGLTNINSYERTCPPKLVVFNLTTDKLVKIIKVPEEFYRVDSFFAYLALDESFGNDKSCDDIRAYIADAGNSPGIVAYDGQTKTFVRRVVFQMYPDPDYSTFRLPNGETFQLMLATYSLVPAPQLDNEYNGPWDNIDLYFQPFTSNRIWKMKIEDVFSPKFDEPNSIPVEQVTYKLSQSAAIAFDPEERTLLYSGVSEATVYSYRPQNNNLKVRVNNSRLITVITDLVHERRCTGSLWLASLNLQDYLNGTVEKDKINHRILYVL